MTASNYGDRLIVTRTSRNGRRLSFQAFENLNELAAAIINAIDLDFDPDWRGSADTIDAEKNRAMQHMHQYGRYIGYGGQWIWERVTSDDQLTFWESVRGPQERGRKSGWYLCTPVPSRWLNLDDYQASVQHKPLAPDVLQQLPPKARFITDLMVTLWTRIHADDESHFNGWLTRGEAAELQRLDLYQPGHSQHRFSIPNEDLSDYAQHETTESPETNGGEQ